MTCGGKGDTVLRFHFVKKKTHYQLKQLMTIILYATIEFQDNIITARKRRLCVHKRLSFCPQGVCIGGGGLHLGWGCLHPAGVGQYNSKISKQAVSRHNHTFSLSLHKMCKNRRHHLGLSLLDLLCGDGSPHNEFMVLSFSY